MEQNILKTYIEALKNNKLSFLLGSGISIESGVPIVGGVDKSNGTIIDGFETYTLQQLGMCHNDICKIINTIPFESFFEVLIDNGIDMNEIAKIFDAPPSTFHYSIASLAANGFLSSIGTTNIDNCIEKALDELGVANCILNVSASKNAYTHPDNSIVLKKFHGSIEDKSELGFSIRNITRRNNWEVRKAETEKFISQNDCMIVCGYSCSDTFDLVPFFNQCPNASTKNILYINHINGKKAIDCVTPIETCDPKIIKMFGKYNTTVLSVDTNFFMKCFLNQAGSNLRDNHIHTLYITRWKDIIDKCLSKFSDYSKLKTVANLYYKAGESDKSISSWQKAIGFSNNNGDTIAGRRSIAWSLIDLGKHSEAKDVLKSLLQESNDVQNKYPLHYANIYSHLGVSCCHTGDYINAETFLKKSIEISDKYNLKREKAHALINLAHVYSNISGKLNLAIELTENAKSIDYELGDYDTIGICCSNLADYYNKANKYENAKTNIEESIKIAEDIGNENALLNRKLNKIELELAHFLKAKKDELLSLKKEAASCRSVVYRANYEHYLGNIEHLTGDLPKAIGYWEKAKELYLKYNIKMSLYADNELMLKQHGQ